MRLSAFRLCQAAMLAILAFVTGCGAAARSHDQAPIAAASGGAVASGGAAADGGAAAGGGAVTGGGAVAGGGAAAGPNPAAALTAEAHPFPPAPSTATASSTAAGPSTGPSAAAGGGSSQVQGSPVPQNTPAAQGNSAAQSAERPIPGTDAAIQRWFLDNGDAKVRFNDALLQATRAVANGGARGCQPLDVNARALMASLSALGRLSEAGQKLAAAMRGPLTTFAAAATACLDQDFVAAQTALDAGIVQQADAQASVDEILEGEL